MRFFIARQLLRRLERAVFENAKFQTADF